MASDDIVRPGLVDMAEIAPGENGGIHRWGASVGGGHGRWVCSCGAVITQCRCIEGHRNTTVVQNGCSNCVKKQK